MQNLLALTTVLFVFTLSTGCNQPRETAPGAEHSVAGIAIIDLDEIARQLGSDKQIVSSIKQREAALNSKLGELADAYTAEFEKHKAALANEQQDNAVQLANYQNQVNQSFNNARAQARQDLTQHRSRLVQKFREAVRPTARKVAQDRGLSVIVTKQDALVYDFAPECDITGAVVESLRKSSAEQAVATKPTDAKK